MKQIIYTYILIPAIVVAALTTWGCQEQRTLYSDAEYVMFADSVSVNIVQQDASTICVPVASTVACDYDRNFGVEIIDGKSKAIEGLHYRLAASTVTIKAGERVANVELQANYDKLEQSDTLNVMLRLVMPDAVKWDLYGTQTNVRMVKSCPFVLEDFTGWCVVTSQHLYYYPGDNTSIQRLIFTEKHPTEENTIILHNFLYDGYDITIRFDPSDPAEPLITMDEEQTLSDEASVFGTIYGDNKIYAEASPFYRSYFMSCGRYVSLFLYIYLENLGNMVGVVDYGAYNVLEWISDEEADRLEREDGLKKSY